jgi:hemerythrin-like domain-containing protein
MNQEELIAKLKEQHKTLKQYLSLALVYVENEAEKGAKKILSELVQFKKDLEEHLTLENGTFYPSYLDKKKARGEDTVSTEKFIKEMTDIGLKVMQFLENYNSVEKITASTDEFKAKLSDVTQTLKVRIESEEEGVYDFYLLM